MSIFDIFRKKQPQNKQITHPADLAAFLQAGSSTLAGIDVTPEKAMSVPAINRGVHLMSDMVAMLPLVLYRRLEQGKERAISHRQYRFLHDKPNSYQTAYQFRYMMQRHLLLRGNAYAFKNRANGYLRELVPIHPNRVNIEQDDALRVTYIVTMPSGLQKEFGPDKIWHLRAHTEDGIIGLGIVDEAPNAIAMCVAAEQHGAMLFGNGAKPSGILSFPDKLSQEQAQRIKESWQDAYGGENKYSTAVLDSNASWSQTAMDNEKAQYLEVRSFQVAEAARLLGIPPILLFHSDTTSTFASAKELVLAFLKLSLGPWLEYWEADYNANILNQEQDGRYFVEFVREGLEKMDLQSRTDAYSKLITNMVMSPNEVRERENLNHVKGLDIFLNPNVSSGGQNNGDNNAE